VTELLKAAIPTSSAPEPRASTSELVVVRSIPSRTTLHHVTKSTSGLLSNKAHAVYADPAALCRGVAPLSQLLASSCPAMYWP